MIGAVSRAGSHLKAPTNALARVKYLKPLDGHFGSLRPMSDKEEKETPPVEYKHLPWERR